MASLLPIPIEVSRDPQLIGDYASSPPSDGAKRELLNRILQSTGFRKSPRTSDFLHYICDKALLGQSGELSEQNIGEYCLARKDGFDPGLDNIVRVTARRVRQKLDEYYATEGQGEPILLSVPVGGYIPRFELKHPHTLELPATAEPDTEPASHFLIDESLPDPTPHIVSSRWIIVVLITVCIAAVAVLVGKQRSVSIDSRLPANAMWSTLFDSNRRSIFVPGDSALVLLENHTHHPVTLDEYISKRYLTQITNNSPLPPATQREEAERPYNAVVDVRFVAQLARLPEAKKPLEIVIAHDLNIEDLKKSNVILSGAREANPWVQIFQSQLDYLIIDHQDGDNYTVLNCHPLAGEPSAYAYKSNDPLHTAYALVAYMPNLSGQGHVLLLQGTTMAGTEAAMDFVLDLKESNKFLASHEQYPAQPFQVLLETTNMNGSSPKSRILSYRFH